MKPWLVDLLFFVSGLKLCTPRTLEEFRLFRSLCQVDVTDDPPMMMNDLIVKLCGMSILLEFLKSLLFSSLIEIDGERSREGQRGLQVYTGRWKS